MAQNEYQANAVWETERIASLRTQARNGVLVGADHLVTDDALLLGHWLVVRRGKQRYELVHAAHQRR